MRFDTPVASAMIGQVPLASCSLEITNWCSDCFMWHQHKPNYGYIQPSYENETKLSFCPIVEKSEKKEGKRGPRPPSAPAMRLRRIFAANVKALVESRYPISHFGSVSDQQKAFARDAGISWSSLQRKLDPAHGCNLDLVADIAVALEVKPEQLLSSTLVDFPRS